jgi:hypothetical protein
MPPSEIDVFQQMGLARAQRRAAIPKPGDPVTPDARPRSGARPAPLSAESSARERSAWSVKSEHVAPGHPAEFNTPRVSTLAQ